MSQSIKGQYEVLRELRLVDDKVFRLQTELEKIPVELQKLDDLTQARVTQLNNEKQRLTELEKKLRAIEQDLKEKEEQLRKAESKMMEVKRNEEYQAALKENELQKKDKSVIEDKTLTLLNEVEEERSKTKKLDQDYNDFRTTVDHDRKNMEAERLIFVNQLEQILQTRNSIMSRLDSEAASLYNRISVRIRGNPIVVANSGMCEGCNMRLRPQLFNEIIGYKAIHRCPNCARLLIPPAPTPQPSEES